MRFMIRRTSNYAFDDVNNPPCEEARLGTFTPRDRRMVNDPAKLPVGVAKMWYEEGTNHRVEDGMIVRDLPPRKAWFITITNLKQLLDLQAKYGNLVLSTSYLDYTTPEIEIYDDYRE